MKKLTLVLAILLLPTTVRADSPLHETATSLIQDFLCHGDVTCLAKRGERLSKAANTVMDTCLKDAEIPKYICLGLVANIANEGGGIEHPSCGGLQRDCVLRCDRLTDSGARHDCFLQCALEQGISRGNPRYARVAKCNDRGSSRGPFQMKAGRIKQCRKLLGDSFDPFDLEQATRCTAQIVKRTATSKRWACGRVSNRWLVAFTRVTRGVIRKVADAQPGRWVKDLHGGKKWFPPTKTVYTQICVESPYGRRGLRYYNQCGKKCYEAPRTAREPLQTLTTVTLR